MKMKLYSIKDTKVAMKNPFLAHNDAEATRMLKNVVNDKRNNSEIAMNPEDHELWGVGLWDDQTGKIESDIRFITKAIDLKEGD